MLTRIPDHVSDNVVHDKVKTVSASVTAALALSATAKATVDTLKTAALGATDGEVGTIQTQMNAVDAGITAIATAIATSGL